MLVISATFRRMDEISVEEALNADGVYVIWRGKNKVRPADIGQGKLLDRIAKKQLKKPHSEVSVLIAVMKDSSPGINKENAELVQALLLEVARQINRWPTEAKKNGALKKVDEWLETCHTIGVNVRGYDPLLYPARPPLRKTKKIHAYFAKDSGEMFSLQIAHDWNRRH